MKKIISLFIILVFASCKNQDDKSVDKIDSMKAELDLYITECSKSNKYLDTNEVFEIVNNHFDPISFGITIDSCKFFPKRWNSQSNDSRWFNITKYIDDSLEFLSNNADLKPFYGKITSNYDAFKIKGRSEFYVEYSYCVYLSEEERKIHNAHQIGIITLCIIAN